MQLTHFTDYALRVLIYVALRQPGERATILDIAERFGVPRNHLIKVVRRLAQLGYLETARGKGGGLRLGKPPAEIGIGQVVRDMESNLKIIDCAVPPCLLMRDCRLKGILDDARDAFLEVLDGYSLAELVHQPDRYQALLRHSAPLAH